MIVINNEFGNDVTRFEASDRCAEPVSIWLFFLVGYVMSYNTN